MSLTTSNKGSLMSSSNEAVAVTAVASKLSFDEVFVVLESVRLKFGNLKGADLIAALKAEIKSYFGG